MNCENYSCNPSGCGHGKARHFLTKEEKIEMLKDYQKNLESETKGISERITELEKAK